MKAGEVLMYFWLISAIADNWGLDQTVLHQHKWGSYLDKLKQLCLTWPPMIVFHFSSVLYHLYQKYTTVFPPDYTLMAATGQDQKVKSLLLISVKCWNFVCSKCSSVQSVNWVEGDDWNVSAELMHICAKAAQMPVSLPWIKASVDQLEVKWRLPPCSRNGVAQIRSGCRNHPVIWNAYRLQFAHSGECYWL